MSLALFVGQRIKALRKEQNMSQEDLAKRLGVANQTVSKFENGQRGTNQDTLAALAEIFGVSVNAFFPEKTQKETMEDAPNKETTDLKEALKELLKSGELAYEERWSEWDGTIRYVVIDGERILIDSDKRRWK